MVGSNADPVNYIYVAVIDQMGYYINLNKAVV